MLQLAPLLYVTLTVPPQVEVVRLPAFGNISASADGTWICGGTSYDGLETLGVFRWSPTGGIERILETDWSSGISDDGQVLLVSLGNDTGGFETGLWTEGGIRILPGFGTSLSIPTALSRNGDFAVGVVERPISIGAGEIFPLRAVRWTSSGDLLELETPGLGESWAEDLSDDGRIVVGHLYDTSGGPPVYSAAQPGIQAALWLDGRLEVLQEGGYALGTSSDGAYVAGWDSWSPWLWHRGQGMVPLDQLPPRHPGYLEFARALQVSDDGATVLCEQNYWLGVQNDLFRDNYLWIRGVGAVGVREILAGLGAPGLAGSDWLRASDLSSDGRVLLGVAANDGPPFEMMFWRAVLPPDVGAFQGAPSVPARRTLAPKLAFPAARPRGPRAPRGPGRGPAFPWTTWP